jgi:uncharacterized repeat protein (TIGR03803 family)
MTKLSAWKWASAIFLLCATTTSVHGQTFTTVLNFGGRNGDLPEYMSLIQGKDGELYGTTLFGGANNQGTAFKMTPAGFLTTIYSFCAQPSCTDGNQPAAGLVLAADGNFYGTTEFGGDLSCSF